MTQTMSTILNVFKFYKEGFQNMSKNSKKLWVIILIKLIIMFGVLKIFFFPNYLNTRFNTDEEKIEHISKELTNTNQ